jgi:hypothetical protein
MSGNAGDAFIWGGATKEEAKHAATNNYYLSENSEDKITTLIKKDGTGKIGDLYIGDDYTKVEGSAGNTYVSSLSI